MKEQRLTTCEVLLMSSSKHFHVNHYNSSLKLRPDQGYTDGVYRFQSAQDRESFFETIDTERCH